MVYSHCDRPEFKSQVRSKSRDHFFSDVGTDSNQSSQHLAPFSGKLSEGYMCGRIEVHLHSGRLVDHANRDIAQNLCFALKSAQGSPKLKRLDYRFGGRDETNARLDADSYIDGAMLVHVRKFVKQPQPMSAQVQSVVRLQTLDYCLRTWSDAPDIARSFA